MTTLGIDVGGTEIKWAVQDGRRTVGSGSRHTPQNGPDGVLDAAAEIAAGLAERPTAIGLAVPGLVDTVAGTTLFVPNLPGEWTNRGVADGLRRRSGLPVAVVNDARAFGYAEFVVGAGRGDRNVVFIVLGTGVGGAIAVDGRLLVAPIDARGEVGHVVVEPDGFICGCGGRGCLETAASGSAIVAHARRVAGALSGSEPVDVAESIGLCYPTPEAVAVAARAGDPVASGAYARAGRSIGIAAASTSVLLQITAVVVGGGVAASFDLLLPHIQSVLEERESLTGPIDVRRAALGSTAGAVGAGLLVADTLTD
jgi:glucokinase